MKWKKLGLVYNSDGKFGWNKLGAFVPTAILMDGFIRVYVSMHDENMVGRIGYVDVDCEDPTKIFQVSKKPIIDIGISGAFDDNGMTPTSIVRDGQRMFLYYAGWQLGVKVRYYLFTGLLVSYDNGQCFEQFSNTPILDRCAEGIFVRSGAGVIKDTDNWKVWYVSGNKWICLRGKQVPTYKMYYATSEDGIVWRSNGLCINHANDDEFGFGRPWVIKENGVYKMFYSIRYKSKGYRLGYAESYDGFTWKRMDYKIGIDVSDFGWDSESLSFASVVDYKDSRYMFYNGSHGGYTGFGVAILKEN